MTLIEKAGKLVAEVELVVGVRRSDREASMRAQTNGQKCQIRVLPRFAVLAL